MQKTRDQINEHFESEYQASLTHTPTLKNATNPKYRGSRTLTHKWEGMQFSQWGEDPDETGYDEETLRQIGYASVSLPDGFTVH